MTAALAGQTQIVKLLLESEAAVDQQSRAGRTALMYCAIGGDGQESETIAALLLEAGARPGIIDYRLLNVFDHAKEHGALPLADFIGSRIRQKQLNEETQLAPAPRHPGARLIIAGPCSRRR
jgi:ankyrin repeat protein